MSEGTATAGFPGRIGQVVTGVLLGLTLWAATDAFASGGGDHGEGTNAAPMLNVLVGVAVIGVAYLLAHFVVRRLQRRYLITTGVEYIALGVLLGPSISAIPGFQDVEPLRPLVALAAGWIGLLYGMELDLRSMLAVRDRALRLALLEGLGSAVPITVVAWYGFQSGLFGDVHPAEVAVCAGVLGLSAWAGSSSGLEALRERYTLDGPLPRVIDRAAGLGDMLSIFCFGVLFAYFHEPVLNPSLERPPTPVEWATLSIGIGLGLGGLFSYYLDEDDSGSSVLLALVGIISFAAGAAFFLELSPLFICLAVGMVMVNTSHAGDQVREALDGTSHPVKLLLLILAGALWTPPPWLLTAALAIIFIVLRTLGKMLGCWIASLGTDLRGDLFRGLVGQGEVAVAMALSFRLVFPSEGADPGTAAMLDMTYSAILISVVVHELFAPRVLRGLFVDAGVIRREADLGG